MVKKVVFLGCSFTAGNGWKDIDPTLSGGIECKDHDNLWVNLCHNRLPQLNVLELLNFGQGGASNAEIFKNSIDAIAKHGDDISIMFCQWTSMPRYNFNVGFELWNTQESLIGYNRTHDVNLSSGITWNREYINDLLDRLLILHHLHWEILHVVKFSNIINSLAKKFNIDVFFINGLCPWDNGYFTQLKDVAPEDYTPFTKKEILNIKDRDDEDIFKLYNLAHQHYKEAGGVNPNQWINLYNSFLKNKIDINFDNQHPGKKSNELYYQLVNQKIKNSI